MAAETSGQTGAGTGDLVERMAEAMCEAAMVGDGEDMPWDGWAEEEQEVLRRAAHAVIPLVAQAQRDADVAAIKALADESGRARDGTSSSQVIYDAEGRVAVWLASCPLITEEARRG